MALITCRGRVWMNQRKETLLKNLWVYLLAENAQGSADVEKALKSAGIQAAFRDGLGNARHVFTHRVWNMTLYHYAAETSDCREGRFVTLSEMRALPLPTAMRAAREQAEKLLTENLGASAAPAALT